MIQGLKPASAQPNRSHLLRWLDPARAGSPAPGRAMDVASTTPGSVSDFHRDEWCRWRTPTRLGEPTTAQVQESLSRRALLLGQKKDSTNGFRLNGRHPPAEVQSIAGIEMRRPSGQPTMGSLLTCGHRNRFTRKSSRHTVEQAAPSASIQSGIRAEPARIHAIGGAAPKDWQHPQPGH